jgi:hypothetical protein
MVNPLITILTAMAARRRLATLEIALTPPCPRKPITRFAWRKMSQAAIRFTANAITTIHR